MVSIKIVRLFLSYIFEWLESSEYDVPIDASKVGIVGELLL